MGRKRDAKRLLSARNLDDIPASVRIGSPYDAPDRAVREWARQGGVHPQTNYGVVYRVAFAPVLEAGEEPIQMPAGALVDGMPQGYTMRFARVTSGVLRTNASGERGLELVDDESGSEGWLLVTNRGLRRHFPIDGIPAIGTGLHNVWGRPGLRYAPFAVLLGTEYSAQTVRFGGVPTPVDSYFFKHDLENGPVIHIVSVTGQGSRENAAWYEAVCGLAEQHNGAFVRGMSMI